MTYLILGAIACLVIGGLVGYLVGRSRATGALNQAIAEGTAWREEAAQYRGRIEGVEREQAILEESADREAVVARLLTPMSARLEDLTQRVATMHTTQAAQEAALRTQLTNAAAITESLNRETQTLRSALTSTSARGYWGEVELRRIVEAAGMMRHVDFSEQHTVDGSGRARPDMTILLPGGGRIAVDSKVPLSALLRAEDLDPSDPRSDNLRRELLSEHARAMRSHVVALAKRDYPSEIAGSPRVTVMFLPSESLLSQTLEADPAFLEDAFGRGITPATPATLLAILRSIASVWSTSQATEEAARIVDMGTTLVTRLATVAGHLDKLGTSLRKSVNSYNSAVASIESRLLVTARGFDSITTTVPTPEPIMGENAQIRSLTAPELLQEPAAGSTNRHDS